MEGVCVGRIYFFFPLELFIKLFWKGPFLFVSKFGLPFTFYVTSFSVESNDSFPPAFLLSLFFFLKCIDLILKKSAWYFLTDTLIDHLFCMLHIVCSVLWWPVMGGTARYDRVIECASRNKLSMWVFACREAMKLKAASLGDSAGFGFIPALVLIDV